MIRPIQTRAFTFFTPDVGWCLIVSFLPEGGPTVLPSKTWLCRPTNLYSLLSPFTNNQDHVLCHLCKERPRSLQSSYKATPIRFSNQNLEIFLGPTQTINIIGYNYKEI